MCKRNHSNEFKSMIYRNSIGKTETFYFERLNFFSTIIYFLFQSNQVQNETIKYSFHQKKKKIKK